MGRHHTFKMSLKEIKLTNDIIIEKSNGKFIMLDPTQGIFFETNSTGREIIKLIKDDGSYDNILNKLNSKYKGFDRVFLDDFIDLLLKKKLIKID